MSLPDISQRLLDHRRDIETSSLDVSDILLGYLLPIEFRALDRNQSVLAAVKAGPEQDVEEFRCKFSVVYPSTCCVSVLGEAPSALSLPPGHVEGSRGVDWL